MSKIIDLTKRTFGRLKVVERSDRKNKTYWKCICVCGKHTTVTGQDLRTGHTKSCGCLNKDIARGRRLIHDESHGRNIYNGKNGTKLYRIWTSMKRRCNNPNNNQYHRYGGRGIIICQEWQNSYLAFKSWAIASGHKKELLLDRRDNDGNYEPSNCRWVNNAESSRNRTMVKLSKKDVVEIRCMFEEKEDILQKDVATAYGVSPTTIYDVVSKRSWKEV